MPNPELNVAQVQRRRRIRTRKARQQRGRCWWCDLPFTAGNRATFEHLVPLAQGGGYWDELNIVAAHEKCNKRRGHLGFVASGTTNRPRWLIEALAVPIVGIKLTADRPMRRRKPSRA